MTTNVYSSDMLLPDVERAILWQYNEAENIQGLLEKKQEWYDANHLDFWFNYLFETFFFPNADEFGLSLWSQILDFPLVVSNGEVLGQPTFGFGANNQNFGNGNFNVTPGSSVVLTPEQAQFVLWLRGYQITSSGAIPEINEILAYIRFNLILATGLDVGRIFAIDNLDMTMTYVMPFDMPAGIRYVIENFDILPRPSGVEVNIFFTTNPSWGFGTNNLNFNNGNFNGS